MRATHPNGVRTVVNDLNYPQSLACDVVILGVGRGNHTAAVARRPTSARIPALAVDSSAWARLSASSKPWTEPQDLALRRRSDAKTLKASRTAVASSGLKVTVISLMMPCR